MIFSELIRHGVKQTPTGRVWNLADSELWYETSEQAQGYLDLEKSKAYRDGVTKPEIELIDVNLDQLVSQLPQEKYNLIDLGCGDGKKAALFISELGKRLRVRYCPVDKSSYMVSKAFETVGGLDIEGVIECKENISNFRDLPNVIPAFRRNGYHNNFVLFLGNTIGNFEPFDRDIILEGILQTMEPSDCLLVGNELRGKKSDEEIVKEYSGELINDFLSYLPQQVGLSHSDVSFEVGFNSGRVELFYQINKDKTVKHLGKKLDFRKGDRILAAISYKYSLDEYKDIFENRGFDTLVYPNKAMSYALALGKK